MLDISFFENKRILVTGHTGFKGAWLCKVLEMFGAIVIGYSLESFTKTEIVIQMETQPIVRGDVNVMETENVLECIRHTESVKSFFNVIGSDFATDRIISDCVRTVREKRNIVVRNPIFC